MGPYMTTHCLPTSSVWILAAVWKICQKLWLIGTGSERESHKNPSFSIHLDNGDGKSRRRIRQKYLSVAKKDSSILFWFLLYVGCSKISDKKGLCILAKVRRITNIHGI